MNDSNTIERLDTVDRIPDEPPEQCMSCGGYFIPQERGGVGTEKHTITMDMDAGNPERGPRPDVCDVSVCSRCFRHSQLEV